MQVGARVTNNLFAVQTIVVLWLIGTLADGAHPLFLLEIAEETEVSIYLRSAKLFFAQRTSCYIRNAIRAQ